VKTKEACQRAWSDRRKPFSVEWRRLSAANEALSNRWKGACDMIYGLEGAGAGAGTGGGAGGDVSTSAGMMVPLETQLLNMEGILSEGQSLRTKLKSLAVASSAMPSTVASSVVSTVWKQAEFLECMRTGLRHLVSTGVQAENKDEEKEEEQQREGKTSEAGGGGGGGPCSGGITLEEQGWMRNIRAAAQSDARAALQALRATLPSAASSPTPLSSSTPSTPTTDSTCCLAPFAQGQGRGGPWAH
jgi:hypothetical protein